MSNTQQIYSSGKARGQGQAQADQMLQPARDKAANAAQSADESREHAAGFLQQTGVQVMNIAHGAADAVKNAVGMGHPDSSTPSADDSTTATTRSSSTTTTTQRH